MFFTDMYRRNSKYIQRFKNVVKRQWGNYKVSDNFHNTGGALSLPYGISYSWLMKKNSSSLQLVLNMGWAQALTLSRVPPRYHLISSELSTPIQPSSTPQPLSNEMFVPH